MFRYWAMFLAGFAWSVYQASVRGEGVLVLVGILVSAWAVRGTMRKDAQRRAARAWQRPATRAELEELFPVLPVTEEEVVLDTVAEEHVPFHPTDDGQNWLLEEHGREGQTEDYVRVGPGGRPVIVRAPYPRASD